MALVLFVRSMWAAAIMTAGVSSAASVDLPPHPQPHHVACIPVNGHQGQPGCWEIGSIPIQAHVGTPLYWHVYEFSTIAEAQEARDDRSRVINAYGRIWLEAVADKQWSARGGRHVATVGPMHTISSLPQTASFMPTGTKDQFTTGKWQLAPSALAVVQLPHISRGSFAGLLVKDTLSFAGDDKRSNINVVSVQPIFNWALPGKWFATFGPEAKFNTKDGWKLFLPFDVTIGKKINARTVVSLQTDIALIDRYQQYNWQTEFRIGFFF